jgi:hypothetical protein
LKGWNPSLVTYQQQSYQLRASPTPTYYTPNSLYILQYPDNFSDRSLPCLFHTDFTIIHLLKFQNGHGQGHHWETRISPPLNPISSISITNSSYSPPHCSLTIAQPS